MSVPQFARISRRELGEIPQWMQSVLDHLQPQIEFITQDMNAKTSEIVSLRIAHNTWTRVKTPGMKKPARHATVSSSVHAAIAFRATGEAQIYEVNVKFDPVPDAPLAVAIEFRAVE